MGCNVSVPSRNAPSPSILLEIAPSRTAGQASMTKELDRDTLLRDLENVAAYLQTKKTKITIITVGGAVNTIFFQSRRTTHDIDFFNDALKRKELALLVEGSRYAQLQDRALQNEWFNDYTVLFIPKAHKEHLTKAAFAQNEVVFQRPSLTVLAAPWDYAIAAKLDRICGAAAGEKSGKPYDLSDAVAYIHRLIQISRVRAVLRSQIYRWAQTYGTLVADPVLQQLAAAYQRTYAVSGVDLTR